MWEVGKEERTLLAQILHPRHTLFWFAFSLILCYTGHYASLPAPFSASAPFEGSHSTWELGQQFFAHLASSSPSLTKYFHHIYSLVLNPSYFSEIHPMTQI